jgi:hypothetical protein
VARFRGRHVDDIIAVEAARPALRERRRDCRIIVSIPGRYILTGRWDLQGNRREFACRAVNISPHALALAAPVRGRMKERVIVTLDHFGKLAGPIIRLLDRGFVIAINASHAERENLADRIVWFESNKNHDVPDARRHKRIVPQSPHSTLILADGTSAQCFVIDMSQSGAAISAEIVPAIGTPLAIGRVVGRVVRHIEGGFAVRFEHIQNRDTLERLLIKP